jgi:hypothetical protein
LIDSVVDAVRQQFYSHVDAPKECLERAGGAAVSSYGQFRTVNISGKFWKAQAQNAQDRGRFGQKSTGNVKMIEFPST